MNLFKLVGSIFVDNEEANKSISKTEKKAEGLGSKFIKGMGTVAKWGAALTGAAVAGAAALTNTAMSAAETTDRIDKLSAKIGISKQSFQEWDYIMAQNGMDVEKLQVGVKTLVQQMEAASKGTETATDAFKALDVSFQNADGSLRSQEEVMYDAIIALANMGESAERARLATVLFGKAGVEMAPMLNSGAEGIKELKERAHELGLVLSDEAVTAGVVLGDTMDDVKKSFGALGTQLGVIFMPIVQQVLDYMLEKLPSIQAKAQEVIPKIGAFLQDVLDKGMALVEWFTELDKGTQILIASLVTFVSMSGTIIPAIDKIKTGVLSLKTAMLGASGEAGGLAAAVGGLSAPVIAVAVAIGALIAAFVTLWTTSEDFRDSITSTIDGIVSRFEGFEKSVVNKINSLGFNFKSVADIIKAVWLGLCEFLAPVFEVYFAFVSDVISAGLDTILGFVDFFVAVFKGDWEGMLDAVIDIVMGWLSYFTAIWNMICGVAEKAVEGLAPLVQAGFERIKANIERVLNNAKLLVFGIFEGMKNGIKTRIEGAFNIVKTVVDKIKGLFDFDFKIPKIKLPHFKITPDGWDLGDLLEGIKPNLSVEWYAKGAVLNQPTLFGVNPITGAAMAGGEAGPEAVAPIDVLQKYIAEAVGNQNTEMIEVLYMILEAIIALDNNMGGKLRGAIKGLALRYDRREVARMVEDVRYC